MSVVLDASALLAYLQLEPGGGADHEQPPSASSRLNDAAWGVLWRHSLTNPNLTPIALEA